MLRLTSFTAATLPNTLLMSFRTTCAMRSGALRPATMRCSTLHGAGQAGHVVLDEERIGDRHRDRSEQRAGHQLAPEEDVAADQLRGDPDRHRLLLGGGDEHERVDELVPRQREGEDAG